jgi:hypothetical protein
MNSQKILNKIEENKKEIKKFGVKKIGLFGSFAKNKQHSRSDIDFLVTFEKINFDNYMNLLFLLEKLFRKKIDLVVEKNLIPELNYVKKEAKYVKL